MRITSVDVDILKTPCEHPLVVPIGTMFGAEKVLLKRV
jgi:hypothetical protein